MQEQVGTLERAGKYLVKTRNLRKECALSATQAARSDNPEVQALAVISVALAEAVGAKDDGWVGKIKQELGYAAIRNAGGGQ